MNGEGIAYAIETAEMAAELLHEALVKDRPGLAMLYPQALRERYGRYFRLGRGFAKLVGKPEIMGPANEVPPAQPRVMGFAMRMMANLTDGRDGPAGQALLPPREAGTRVVTVGLPSVGPHGSLVPWSRWD